ncbi:proteasome subunit beta [Ignicoccus islandicus DSM 13165]|uniref:Proteasome subunit beta n=1 Tax=Ignicoccus islandicus DSM 13165 TaxID=940295 RepID=A0A0U3FR31_9CREN|nr:archaeal proteasome endopeptidase complex subunit beta [Ignicoccus islandicus]ALU11936.1 proteasome subunit beta [Ignicoccus islandicus DSM 13165]
MDYKPKPIKGTTTVGIRTSNAVILAADKRATAGNMIVHKNVVKIIKISDYMALTTAGLVADAQMLAEVLRNEVKRYELSVGKRMSVRAAATFLSNILFGASRYYPYIVQFLLGGYDTAPRLFSLDWFGTVAEEKFLVTGSGSPMAVGVLEAEYREDMEVEEAVKLALKAVYAATQRDTASGEGIDVAIITEGGIKFERHTLDEVKGLTFKIA